MTQVVRMNHWISDIVSFWDANLYIDFSYTAEKVVLASEASHSFQQMFPFTSDFVYIFERKVLLAHAITWQ